MCYLTNAACENNASKVEFFILDSRKCIILTLSSCAGIQCFGVGEADFFQRIREIERWIPTDLTGYSLCGLLGSYNFRCYYVFDQILALNSIPIQNIEFQHVVVN